MERQSNNLADLVALIRSGVFEETVSSITEVEELATAYVGQHPEIGVLTGRAIGRIAFEVAQIERSEKALDEAVAAARTIDLSWKKIGTAARMSAQGAYQRWDSNGRENSAKAAKRYEERRHRGATTNSQIQPSLDT